MPATRITAVNHYTLTAPAPDFQAATLALAARVRDQGHPGILSYRFFVNADQATARAVVDYADADAWIGHHDIAMGWPEMAALRAASQLTEITLLGPVTSAILEWLARSGLTATVITGHAFAAGFCR